MQTPCKPLRKLVEIKSGSGLNNLQYGVQSNTVWQTNTGLQAARKKFLAIFFTSDVITINFFLVAFKCAQNILFSTQREHELDWIEGQIYENKKKMH